jgi:hypothetical protein
MNVPTFARLFGRELCNFITPYLLKGSYATCIEQGPIKEDDEDLKRF